MDRIVNPEASKQFAEIFEAHHNPGKWNYIRLRKQKEKKIRDKGEDLGLDMSQKG